MVNNPTDSPKNHILTMLRESSRPLSGEFLGTSLGISRVAIHKHIRRLKAEGYRLEAGSRGYRLMESSRDPFTSWEFSAGEQVIVLKETGSTMDEAHRRAAVHPGEDFILAAEAQTGGRGRREREWSSPAGGLWLTRVIHPESSVLETSRYTMGAAAALAGLLKNQYNIAAEVKWPNDVLIKGRKVAGILVEGRFTGDRLQYLAIGLGMNVNNSTAEDRTGLKELLGHEEDRRQLLRGWVQYSDELFNSAEFRRRKNPGWWNELMAGVGDAVEYRLSDQDTGRGTEKSDRFVRGRILRADSLGRLVIRKENGRKVRLAAGDIEEKNMNDNTVRSIVLVAAFTALVWVGAIFSFPAPWNPLVPFTMATLFVILSGMILGPWRGLAVVGIYLLLGIIGLPVFSGMQGGFQVIAGPTGGFLIGYALAALFAGLIVKYGGRGWLSLVSAAVMATLAIYMPGTPWMHFQLTGMVEDWSWASTWARYTAPFLIGDGVKAVAAVVIARYLGDRISPASPRD